MYLLHELLQWRKSSTKNSLCAMLENKRETAVHFSNEGENDVQDTYSAHFSNEEGETQYKVLGLNIVLFRKTYKKTY